MALPWDFRPLEGPRVRLDLLRPDDFDALYAIQSDPEVCRYLLYEPRSRREGAGSARAGCRGHAPRRTRRLRAAGDPRCVRAADRHDVLQDRERRRQDRRDRLAARPALPGPGATPARRPRSCSTSRSASWACIACTPSSIRATTRRSRCACGSGCGTKRTSASTCGSRATGPTPASTRSSSRSGAAERRRTDALQDGRERLGPGLAAEALGEPLARAAEVRGQQRRRAVAVARLDELEQPVVLGGDDVRWAAAPPPAPATCRRRPPRRARRTGGSCARCRARRSGCGGSACRVRRSRAARRRRARRCHGSPRGPPRAPGARARGCAALRPRRSGACSRCRARLRA